MKKSVLILGLAATAVGFSAAGNAAVVINEVYAGGGSSVAGTTYTRDFVELYNTGNLPVSLAGDVLQYASAAGGFTNTIVGFDVGTIIGAGDYLTVVTGSAGSAGATLTVTNANYIAPTSSASLSNSSGAVRLYDSVNSVAIDTVGYGGVTSPGSNGDVKVEGTAAPAPTNTTTSLNRTSFADSQNNSADFSNLAPSPTLGLTSTVVATPEPASLGLLLAGGLLLNRRRSL